MSVTYEVLARRWARGWELHIDGVGVTQSRTLTDAEEMVRDYIALDLGIEPDTFEVRITPEIGGGVDENIVAVRTQIRAAEQAMAVAAERSREIVRELTARGLSGREVARVLGVSPQRVSQLIRSRSGNQEERCA